jgi:hypothetical protein
MELIGCDEQLCQKVASPYTNNIGKVLLMYYHMEQDREIAKELGDQISIKEQPDGSWVSIIVPNPDRLRNKKRLRAKK